MLSKQNASPPSTATPELATPRVRGTVMWGRPNEDDVGAMCDVWDAHMQSSFARDPTLTDIRGIESVDLLAFERLMRTFAEHGSVWTAHTGLQAIVRAGGLVGAAILGALQLVSSEYELSSFDASVTVTRPLRRGSRCAR